MPLLILKVLIVLLATAQEAVVQQNGDQEKNSPNIILINLDDADAALFEAKFSDDLFPEFGKLKQEGIWLDNMHVTTPICGPSRACLYSGRYAHRTNIRVNSPNQKEAFGFKGGYKLYRDQGFCDDDLGVWMKRAGYRTMMVGKYLHSDFQAFVPPGWDDFYVSQGAKYFGIHRFTNQHDPNGSWQKLSPDEYRTNVESADALRLIKTHITRRRDQPFFLNINPFAPHFPVGDPEMLPANRKETWPRIKQPSSPSYRRAIINSKGPLDQLDDLSGVDQGQDDADFRRRAIAVKSVDQMIGQIRNTIKRLGVSDNTYIFVTSDNGYCLGHHLAYGKTYPLNRSTRVPCFVIGPGVVPNVRASPLIGQLDIGPTLVELAGGTIVGDVDGRSFAALLDDKQIQTSSFRSELLLENWEGVRTKSGQLIDCAYNSIRTPQAIYTEWSNGERDYFDLAADPHQLRNCYSQLTSAEKNEFASKLRKLKHPEFLARATITEPRIANAELASDHCNLTGYYESGEGVTRLRVSIQDVESLLYWNGESWQTDFVNNPALLATSRPLIGKWEFPITEEIQSESSGSYIAHVWAFDDKPESSPPAKIRFRTSRAGDQLEGNSFAAISKFNDPTDKTGVLRGTAGGPVEVESVKLTLRDLKTKSYWNGEAWQSEFAQIETRLIASKDADDVTGWEYQLPEGFVRSGSGKYKAWAIALDRRARYEPPVEMAFSISPNEK